MSSIYDCWFKYDRVLNQKIKDDYQKYAGVIFFKEDNAVLQTAANELAFAFEKIFGHRPMIINEKPDASHVFVGTAAVAAEEYAIEVPRSIKREGFSIKSYKQDNHAVLQLIGNDPNGVIYSVFYLIKAILCGKALSEAVIETMPKNQLRMINHWDNISGDVERGYAGQSLFFANNAIRKEYSRVKDYARILASIGINALTINNVNVHQEEMYFITNKYLADIAQFANIFRKYGIKLFLSVNFAAPIRIGNLSTADPVDEEVKNWWKKIVQNIYKYIPDFGGFLIKADSEHEAGPFSYGRNHAEGANVLAAALKPFDGLVIWRGFVYDCELNWRNRKFDRAKASYDNFKPLDGQFMDNVIIQVKNGPVDFQIREPVHPLFGAMEKTNELLEVQITQEYTGQQKDLCYLVPMWKECLDFDTYAKGGSSPVKNVISGELFKNTYGGMVGVSNIGDDKSWTGNPLAQANLYGFGMLAWNPDLTSEAIAEEWTKLTFGFTEKVVKIIVNMLVQSRRVYEDYTAPLGIGWMVNPDHHYGPSVDGYEYARWGTYHYADFKGIGVDRTVATGTGYAGQYRSPMAEIYESVEACPEKLLLFFHHMPYKYKLKNGQTLLQYIYDRHFKGVEAVKGFIDDWRSLQDYVESEIFDAVAERFIAQLNNAEEWRDVVNTYFYRKTGIKDDLGRKIYE
ncbi:MAG: alpha-glucuronidase [Firmicutes bacterium]|nr:alpha-glucuronidase [Bacillota bacterium]